MLLASSGNSTLSCRRPGPLRWQSASWRLPMHWLSMFNCSGLSAVWVSSAWFCGVLTESGGLLLGLVAQLIGGGEVVLPRDWDVFMCESKRAVLPYRRGPPRSTDLFGCSSNVEGWTEGRKGPLFLFEWKLSGIEKQINGHQAIRILLKKV